MLVYLIIHLSGSILLEQFSPNNPNEINSGVLNFKDNSTLYVIDLKFDNTTSWKGITIYFHNFPPFFKI